MKILKAGVMELKMKDFHRQVSLKRRSFTQLELFSRQKDCPIKVESRFSGKRMESLGESQSIWACRGKGCWTKAKEAKDMVRVLRDVEVVGYRPLKHGPSVGKLN